MAAKGKIAKALGYNSTDAVSAEDEPKVGTTDSKAEVMAMRAFMRADTAEGKAAALKDFMEACGAY